MTAELLKLEGVTKSYPITRQASDRWHGFWRVLLRGEAPAGSRVLDHIDMTVRRGESAGIIGENGAGKSTLLKIVTGVLSASSGTLTRNGTSAALLELGAGFDPDYTGIDNLRMNASMLGLGRQDVEAKLDEILDFADIGDAINEPVKHYSSGMVVRLGFAVIVAVSPDLLITDEVLAVGDESFQKKCIRWMEGYLSRGGTLLMVSHNMYQVQKLCQQAYWLHGGRIHAAGDVFSVTHEYLAWHERKNSRQIDRESRQTSAYAYQVRALEICSHEDAEPCVEMHDELEVRLELYSPDDRPPVGLIGVTRADGTPVYGVATDHDGYRMSRIAENLFACRLVLKKLALLPGGYCLRGHAMDPEGVRLQDSTEMNFSVRGSTRELGMVRLEHEWMDP